MQLHGLLDILPLWAVFALTVVAALLSFKGGLWLGNQRRKEQEQETVVRGMVGGMLGLLAFMLAFTFGVAAAHFDARRQALLDEASVIRTAYLRADLLSEPHRTEIHNRLREYVDVRVEGLRSGKIEQAIARSERLQDALWSEGIAAREKASNPAYAIQFIQSLNELIAIHVRRLTTGFEFRIPNVIWIVLYTIMALASASIGYHTGLTGSNRPLVSLAFILAFSSVIYLIDDLDRPLNGALKVSQRALVDLQRTMNGSPR